MGIGYVVRDSCSGTSFYIHFQVSVQLLREWSRVFTKVTHKVTKIRCI